MGLSPTRNEGPGRQSSPPVSPQSVVDALPVAIIHVDRSGLVTGWNPWAEQMFGWSRSEVLGRTLPTIPTELEADFRARLQHVLAGGTVSDMEAVRLRKDGRRIEVCISGAAVRDATGGVVGAVASFTDITGRKRTERALQETESRYQTLFERNPFPMWAYDIQSLRFLAVNDAAVEHYGYAREEFLEMTIKDIRPPHEVSRLLDDVANVASGGVDPQSWNAAIWKHRKKDGAIFDVEIRSTTLSFGGWQARLVLAKDVSTERRLEDQLRQAQKMDAVGRLAGGIAHDFNNILFVISGYAEQIQRRAEGIPKEKAVGILKATDRAAMLTRQLLMFSRKGGEEPQILSLNTIVSEMEHMLPRLIGEQITLVVAVAAAPWKVKADPGHVEQVIMNLAVNARDAMAGGGRLVIETKNVELDETYARSHLELQPGEYVMLSVSDTGTGMDAEVQKHIFEPFFTTKSKEKGTGLGLAIVYGIVKQAGGSIQVYSHVGRGTTFKVYLPRVMQTDAAVGRVQERTAPRGGSETVLVAEDEDDVRALARETLEEHGYTVLEAIDAPTAVVLARNHRPQLLLTDMVLKTMMGTDLAEQLRLLVPGLRVLLMSGYTDGALASQVEFERTGAFLQKPFTLDLLLRKVREVLDA